MYIMVEITIACLIYKSTRWLQFVYDQVKKYTDLSANEFYFVANDANKEVLNYLINNNIPHYIHSNTDEQKKEWYINNVYRAWNTAGNHAKGKYVVFINSDMAFTPGWLDVLKNKITDNTCINSRLVERGILRSGLYGIEQNFGDVPENYRDDDFVFYSTLIKQDILMPSGLYMPLLIKKEHFVKINGYPEGNIVPGTDIFNPLYAKLGEPCISGDRVFIDKLKTIGVEHLTAFDSIIYHFQEGEMRDTL